MHFFLISRHAYMTLIYAETLINPLWTMILPLILANRDVYSVEWFVLVLVSVVYPGWYSVLVGAVGQLNLHLYAWKLGNVGWDLTCPLPKTILRSDITYFFAQVLTSFPAIEIPKNRDTSGTGSPLSVNKNVPLFVNAISPVTFRHLIKSTLSFEVLYSLINKFPDLREVFLNELECT